jgi:hypothetical protein
VNQGTDPEDGHGRLIGNRSEATDPAPALDLTEPAAEPSVPPTAVPPIGPEPRVIPDGTDRPDGVTAVPIGLRTDRAIDSVLDELAAEVVGWPGPMAVHADPIAPPAARPEPAGGPEGLAVALIVAGSWGHRACLRGVTSRRGMRPRRRKESD